MVVYGFILYRDEHPRLACRADGPHRLEKRNNSQILLWLCMLDEVSIVTEAEIGYTLVMHI